MEQSVDPTGRHRAGPSLSVPGRRQPTAPAAKPVIPTLRDADDTCRLEPATSALCIMGRVAKHLATSAGGELLANDRALRGFSSQFASARHSKVSGVRDPAPHTDEFPKFLYRVHERVALHMARELASYVMDRAPPRGT